MIPHGVSSNILNTSTFIHCKGCRKSCAPELFTDHIRGKTFKQCSDCRYRGHVRRQPTSLQVQSGKKPQYLHPVCVKVNFYFILIKIIFLVPVNSHSVTDADIILCRKCKKNCPSELFVNPTSNALYATCSNCRSQDHAHRYPTVFEPTPIQHPLNHNGKQSII